jgi:nucleotide-binding universal stress UspA family protein
MNTCTSIGIRNILFPTDFSNESIQAVEFVRRLQHRFGAKVDVAHVVDLFPFSLGSDPAAVSKIEEIRSAGNAHVREFMQAQQLEGDGFHPALLSGEVSFAVDEFTREHATDLIVLGSRGDVGISRLFEGSMAEEIFRTTRCPVLVVGPKAGTVQNSDAFHHLFFPTDLSPLSKAAVPYIEFLLVENPLAGVSLAHFLERDPGSPYEQHKLRLDAERELTKMITPSLRDRIRDIAVEFCSPEEGMIEMARGLPADLMVLGVRYGGSFTRAATHDLCSITHHIIAQAPCPVLTVRSR